MAERKRQRQSYINKWRVLDRQMQQSRLIDQSDDTDNSTESVTIPSHPEMSKEDSTYNKISNEDTGNASEINEREMSRDLIHAIWDSQHQQLDSESSSSDFETGDDKLLQQLRTWACEEGVTHKSIDRLLRIIKENGHANLPSTAKTLLLTNTNSCISIENKSGVEYVYLGLKEKLSSVLDRYPTEVISRVEGVELSCNVDGLPLFKSSGNTAWPILFALHLTPCIVFPSAITIGKSKPNDLDFLRDTIEDLHSLLNDGLLYKERRLAISLRCIVADAPALAFIKNVKQYSGYFGCERCSQRGIWSGRKVIFSETQNFNLRTDVSFRNKEQMEHHLGETPFSSLPIDMVECFSKDYMHVICLGVVRRLILTWLRGPRSVKISAHQKQLISDHLLQLQVFMPREFARKPRSLDDIDRYKATEFRQLLLYTGKVVLKSILPEPLYHHFLVLNVAMAIFLSPSLLLKYADYASSLVVYFVEQGMRLYSNEFLVYNVHSMLHLVDVAGRYGSLDNCSAFCFENYLYKMKRKVRSGFKPLTQLVNRLHEDDEVQKDKTINSVCVDKISTHMPNNAYILSATSCCEVIDYVGDGNMYKCRIYEKGLPYFNYPCDSRLVGTMVVNRRNSKIGTISATKLKKRGIFIYEDGKLIAQGLLHSYTV